MNLRPIVLAAFFLLAGLAAARAQLVWEKTTVEVRPAFGEGTAVAHFNYENKGTHPIKIVSVRPSCGCTVATLKKNDVAPGEKGEITATLSIGDHVGEMAKTLSVETDDKATGFVLLTLKVLVPQLLEIKPALIYWEVGEAPKAKMIAVKAGDKVDLKGIDVTSSTPDFQVTVKSGGAGEFRVSVQPRDTGKPTLATLTIKPDVPNQRAKVFTATARVTPAAGAAR